MVITKYGCFFTALYLPQEGDGELLFWSNGGAGPLQALLAGAQSQQAVCQLWFYFQDNKKGRWCEIRLILKLGWHFITYRRSQLIGAAMAWQKTSPVPTCFGLENIVHVNLCWGLMNVSYMNGFSPRAVSWRRQSSSWWLKNSGYRLFFLSV